MTSRAIYNFQRGEPIVIGRAVLSGDATGLEAAALMKPSRGMVVPGESVEPIATFTSEFVAAAGEDPAHWLFYLSAEQASALPPGTYATDVRFSIDGEPVAITEPAWIVIDESVSG